LELGGFLFRRNSSIDLKMWLKADEEVHSCSVSPDDSWGMTSVDPVMGVPE
jgi:hypothetical protein